MSKKAESSFRQRVDPLLWELPNCFWESISQKAILGTPDKLGCLNGFFIALEFKTDKGELSEIQRLKMQRIVEAGGYAFVVTPINWPGVHNLLRRISLGEKIDVKTNVETNERSWLRTSIGSP